MALGFAVVAAVAQKCLAARWWGKKARSVKRNHIGLEANSKTQKRARPPAQEPQERWPDETKDRQAHKHAKGKRHTHTHRHFPTSTHTHKTPC